MKLSMWCWVGWIRKVGNFRPHILVQISDSNLLRSIFADWNRSTVDLYRRHLNHRPLSERWLCLGRERPWFDFSALSREFPRHEKGQESSLQIPATFFKSFAVKGKLKTELQWSSWSKKNLCCCWVVRTLSLSVSDQSKLSICTQQSRNQSPISTLSATLKWSLNWNFHDQKKNAQTSEKEN